MILQSRSGDQWPASVNARVGKIVNFHAVNTNNQILFQKNFKIAKIDLGLQ